MAQCTATSKRSGQRCNNAPVTGTTTCRMHGGTAAIANRGRGNGNYKHGRHSKYLPANLAEKYHEAQRDPDLLAHREEIVLLDTLLNEALERLGHDAGHSETLWAKANAHVEALEIALATKDARKRDEAFIKLRNVIRAGQSDAETRAEVRQLVQERSKVGERETKRIVAMKAMLTAEQAMDLFRRVLTVIDETIVDEELRGLLYSRIAQLQGPAS